MYGEATVPAESLLTTPFSLRTGLAEILPDLNCDRAEGGRWTRLRDDLDVLVRHNTGSAKELLGWSNELERVAVAHGLRDWLPQTSRHWLQGDGIHEQLVAAVGVAATLAAVDYVCPLGIATVVTVWLVAHLAQAHADLTAGSIAACVAKMSDPLLVAARAIQGSLRLVFGGVHVQSRRLLVPALAATRWPLLDALAVAEKHVLGPLQGLMRMFDGRVFTGGLVAAALDGAEAREAASRCVESRGGVWPKVAELARRLAFGGGEGRRGRRKRRRQSAGRWGTSNASSGSRGGSGGLGGLSRRLVESLGEEDVAVPQAHCRRDDHSNEIANLAKLLDFHELTTADVHMELHCRPLLMQYVMLLGLTCVEQSFVALNNPDKDPEACLHVQDSFARIFLLDELATGLRFQDFANFPIFGGVWQRFRQLATHRFDMPPLVEEQLAGAFGLIVGRSLPPKSPGLEPLDSAISALRARFRQVRPVSILTMLWGERLSARLPAWLGSLDRAGDSVLARTIVLCFQPVALEACRGSHSVTALCVDSVGWPTSSMSKLVGIAVILSRNVDVLWLDSDAVVLQDPVPFLLPWKASKVEQSTYGFQVSSNGSRQAQGRRGLSMLWSVEADSLNCVNSGVFYLRASLATRRFVAYWASLLLERPTGSDQSTIGLLLGLLPMNYSAFAAREGFVLTDSVISRAHVLGPLRTPAWAALDGQRRFTATFEVTYGGIKVGHLNDVAVFHMLESWPQGSLPNPLYADLRSSGLEPVEVLLDALRRGDEESRRSTRTLLQRSERDWMTQEGFRDCRAWYYHGR
eukprot:TRINITY_DN33992_c0_g2_i1.p1 TRINITY_DN33992_c0_g2~~TRINITY_DN33992_c0_g2_i1.p1  ORF type:complete len:805 (-),score=128.25 TRINITY_DN33992_c0_g2_i1:40-2454(-)